MNFQQEYNRSARIPILKLHVQAINYINSGNCSLILLVVDLNIVYLRIRYFPLTCLFMSFIHFSVEWLVVFLLICVGFFRPCFVLAARTVNSFLYLFCHLLTFRFFCLFLWVNCIKLFFNGFWNLDITVPSSLEVHKSL